MGWATVTFTASDWSEHWPAATGAPLLGVPEPDGVDDSAADSFFVEAWPAGLFVSVDDVAAAWVSPG
ncbi:hypothetical protein [Nocardia cyriacigeorgica]|uniref:hypothetical protein n=1 Tax=Nocardia cyriacigeorgica TaxID=135487 RepID=UPI003CC80161